MARLGDVYPYYEERYDYPYLPFVEPTHWWDLPPKEVKSGYVVTTTTTNVTYKPERLKDYVPE